MKSLVLAAAGVIGFALVDLSLFKIYRKKHTGTVFALVINNEGLKKEAKKKRRAYKSRKYKKRPYDKRKAPSFKLKGSKPKDTRFSNQQKLRRMCRNG